MARTRRLGATALLAALTLALGACTLPRLPGQDGPDLAGDDVITLSQDSAGVFGYFGSSSTEVTADTVTERFVLPNDVEIFAVAEEITPEHRATVEGDAEAYLTWERTLSDEDLPVCTDIPPLTVEISGSTTHESTVQDCMQESPLRVLDRSVRSAQSELPGQLARPTGDWTIEIRPWGEDGPDESAPVERYQLSAAEHEIGMGITAQNAPAGWGEGLEPDTGEGSPLGWDATGTVLTGINDFLLGQRQLGCGDQTGEIRVIHEGSPSTTWAYSLCPGQQSEVLAEILRGL